MIAQYLLGVVANLSRFDSSSKAGASAPGS